MICPINDSLTPADRERHEAEQAVRVLIRYIGEDPDRQGLVDTPHRFVKALIERTSGYRSETPEQIMAKSFPTDDTNSNTVYDGMVVQKNIPLISRCEHHIEDIIGVCHVAYIPGEKVAGLSKLIRLVDCFARRLQIQERLTAQIADSLMEHLNCAGAACIIEASHSCISCRGVQKQGTTTRTACLRGLFLSNAAVRSELMFHLGAACAI